MTFPCFPHSQKPSMISPYVMPVPATKFLSLLFIENGFRYPIYTHQVFISINFCRLTIFKIPNFTSFLSFFPYQLAKMLHTKQRLMSTKTNSHPKETKLTSSEDNLKTTSPVTSGASSDVGLNRDLTYKYTDNNREYTILAVTNCNQCL